MDQLHKTQTQIVKLYWYPPSVLKPKDDLGVGRDEYIPGESHSLYADDNANYRFGGNNKTATLYYINCNTKKRTSGEGLWKAVVAGK